MHIEIEDEEEVESPRAARRTDILPSWSHKISIDAYTNRKDEKIGNSSYLYHGDTAWSISTFIEKEFRGEGLGYELFSRKLEDMRSREVQVVYAIGNTIEGDRMIRRHGFTSDGAESLSVLNSLSLEI